MAVIPALPGNRGVMVELPGIVVGLVETNSRLSPVSTVWFLSVATALRGCGLLGLTVTVDALLSGTERLIETGGQVEKKPAELPALATVAVMMVEPGFCAVATPFSSIFTIESLCGAYSRWPTRQLMLVWGEGGPS